MQLDIKEYYPSITEETLDKAISFASNHTTLSLEHIRIIKQSWKSLLFHLEQPWKKKESSSCFDVTTGSFGAELCELNGIFMQSVLQDIINKEAMGLYWDDGRIVLNNITSEKTDKIRKKISQVFKDNGFSIDIVTNLVEVNFLDVTFNLRNGSCRSSKKPSDEYELKYINVLSNHPPQFSKQLAIRLVTGYQEICQLSKSLMIQNTSMKMH